MDEERFECVEDALRARKTYCSASGDTEDGRRVERHTFIDVDGEEDTWEIILSSNELFDEPADHIDEKFHVL